MSKSLAAGLVGLTALLAMSLPGGEARAQQHWFYGNYGYYDGQEYYEVPEPRYMAPRRERRYVPPYPRPWFWRSAPRDEVIEYEAAPNQWVRVYPDGSQETIERPRRRQQAEPYVVPQRQKQKEARRSPAKQAVPLPKAKPTITARNLENSETALLAPDLPAIEEEVPAEAPAKAPATGETAKKAPADKIETGSLKAVSCEEAQRIVADFGFSDVKPRTCAGKVYDMEATRDGQPYEIKLSSADGELTEVKKR
ncbi:MAG: hypothetical protein AB7S41_00020 [Parvibaculaceae bacterium]